jgi:hypothetical protein
VYIVVASPPSLAPHLDIFVIQHSFKIRFRVICSSRHNLINSKVDFRVIISVTVSLNIFTKVLNTFKSTIKGLITIFLRYNTVEIAVNLLPSYTGNIFIIYMHYSILKVLLVIVFNN